MNEEFRIYHVARNAARHNSALDDELYGTPEPSVGERDWTLDNPKKYLDDINAELPKVDRAIDDLIYILKEKNLLSKEFFWRLAGQKYHRYNWKKSRAPCYQQCYQKLPI